jgi:hypothetical protein
VAFLILGQCAHWSSVSHLVERVPRVDVNGRFGAAWCVANKRMRGEATRNELVLRGATDCAFVV